MKINTSHINSINSESIAILVYGTDYGLICEKLSDLTRAYFKNETSDQSEYNVLEISSQDITKEPRLLFDEANSMSLLSNKKIIKINNANDSIKLIMEKYLENPNYDSLFLLHADSLSPASTLRKLFENHKTAKILPCYSDDIKSIDSLVVNMFKKENISIETDARQALVERLGLDRLVTKTEIEKAILFCNPGGHLKYDQVISFVGDQTSINLEKLADSILLGDLTKSLSILSRLEKEDTHSIQIIKVLLKQLHNLHKIKISILSGISFEKVINNFRPTIYFKRKPHISKQIKFWSLNKITKALSVLYKAELECKRSARLQKTLVRQAIVGLCLLASK